MNTNRAASACLGVLVGVLLLGALIFVGGCSSNTASTITTPADQQIFVIQGGSVSVFPLTASGNVAPTATLSGANTKLTDAHRMAFDTQFNAYVTDADTNGVYIYAPGTKGNSAPAATISGGNTGLDFPEGIALDAQNHIYVANGDGNTVTAYAAGATGNAKPTVTISGADTGLDGPNGLAVDSIGDVYVANEFGNTVTIYYGGDISTGILQTISPGGPQDIVPLLTIGGADTGIARPHALTVDGSFNVYLTNSGNNSVTIYAGAIPLVLGGLVPPYSVQDLFPTVTIVGAATGLAGPNGIAFDGSGNLYVTNNLSSVMIYSAKSIGDAITAYSTCLAGPPAGTPAACTQTLDLAPVATITGANTGFTDVHGVNVQAVP